MTQPSLVLIVAALVAPLAHVAPLALVAPLAHVAPLALVAPWAFVAPAATSAAQASAWMWPLSGQPRVTRGFDPPPRPWLAGHRGVDLGGTADQAVRAAGAGVVAFAGEVAGRGVVSVDHAGGLRTTYEPLSSTVEEGDRVAAGQNLGTLQRGHAGCPVEACLHWGLRRSGTYLNPLWLVRPPRVRLKPLEAPASARASAWAWSSARVGAGPAQARGWACS